LIDEIIDHYIEPYATPVGEGNYTDTNGRTNIRRNFKGWYPHVVTNYVGEFRGCCVKIRDLHLNICLHPYPYGGSVIQRAD